MRFLFLTLALCLLPASASACPFCDGSPGEGNAVRAEVFGPDFWPHLLAVAAPFATVGAAAVFLSRPHREARP